MVYFLQNYKELEETAEHDFAPFDIDPGSVQEETVEEADLVEINSTNFDSTVSKGEWLCLFCSDASDVCDILKPLWSALSNDLKKEGKVSVAKIDADENLELLDRFDITSFPAVFLFKEGRMFEYDGKGDLRQFKDFANQGYKKSISRSIPPKDPTEEHLTVLNGSNFDQITSNGVWFIEFIAPWCPQCKEFRPVLGQLINELEKEGVKFGKINANEQDSLASKFAIHKLPTIVLIRSGKYFVYDKEKLQKEDLLLWIKQGHSIHSGFDIL